MNKIDYWFTVLVSLLFVIMVFDMSVTMYALDNGFSEGNPIVRYGFENIGIQLTAIIYFILTFISCFTLIYIRQIITEERGVRCLYTLMSILICYRAFIIGVWWGQIGYLLHGVL